MPAVVVIIIVIVVLVAVAVFGWFVRQRRRLRARFGAEYERLVKETGSVREAERELRERERRHAELEIRPLSPAARERYTIAWDEIQVRFVDAPNDSVGEADQLVTELITEHGYPTGGFDQQLSILSVEHAATLDRYRTAHEIHLRNTRGEATTEDLRLAVVHYRALFTELLRPDTSGGTDEHSAAPQEA